MMCEFCNNIQNVDMRDKQKGTQIVKAYGRFHIWDNGGGDSFYEGISLRNISFCPMCGRKLVEE